MSASVQAVTEANARLQKALYDHDIAAIDALYSDDCDLLVSNTPLIRDRESILDFYRNLYKDKGYKVTFWSIRMIAATSGDLVTDVGHVRFEPSNAPAYLSKYTVTWRKYPGDVWLMEVDSVSPDA